MPKGKLFSVQNIPIHFGSPTRNSLSVLSMVPIAYMFHLIRFRVLISALLLALFLPLQGDTAGLHAAPSTKRTSSYKTQGHKLDILKDTLTHVGKEYVDPDRIEPSRMLFAALNSIQFYVPEVLINPASDKKYVTVTVNDKKQIFSTQKINNLSDLLKRLRKIFSFVQRNMNSDTDAVRMEYETINGVLSTLDPHSILLTPEESKEFDVRTTGSFGGIGIVIGLRNGNLTVIRPLKNQPAEKAGVVAGDTIVQIDAAPTENLTLSEAANQMRGPIGSRVQVLVRRSNKPDLLKFSPDQTIHHYTNNCICIVAWKHWLYPYQTFFQPHCSCISKNNARSP